MQTASSTIYGSLDKPGAGLWTMNKSGVAVVQFETTDCAAWAPNNAHRGGAAFCSQ
ncbi:MAG: hypothetical protein JWP29_5541 [Rhodoferax sp.]|nr:hypothetical protein [Rhodoferax sp.]